MARLDHLCQAGGKTYRLVAEGKPQRVKGKNEVSQRVRFIEQVPCRICGASGWLDKGTA